MTECTVKQRGKFFIVVDPFHHRSYTLNNKLEAENLCSTLNEAAYCKNEVKVWVSKMSKVMGDKE